MVCTLQLAYFSGFNQAQSSGTALNVLSHSVVSNPPVTPWTIALQAPLSLGFFRQEHKWVSISTSRGSSQPRDRTLISCIAGRSFTTQSLGKHTALSASWQFHSCAMWYGDSPSSLLGISSPPCCPVHLAHSYLFFKTNPWHLLQKVFLISLVYQAFHSLLSVFEPTDDHMESNCVFTCLSFLIHWKLLKGIGMYFIFLCVFRVWLGHWS